MTSSRLKPCPKTPNCVSSLADPSDKIHFIAPLAVPGERDAAIARIRAVVEGMRGTRIEEEEDGFLHAVYTTRLFRFADDVKFEWASEGVVHVRSRARKGTHDLGVNRRRVETLRKLLA